MIHICQILNYLSWECPEVWHWPQGITPVHRPSNMSRWGQRGWYSKTWLYCQDMFWINFLLQWDRVPILKWWFVHPCKYNHPTQKNNLLDDYINQDRGIFTSYLRTYHQSEPKISDQYSNQYSLYETNPCWNMRVQFYEIPFPPP